MTKYQLTRAVLGHQPRIDLTREEFEALTDAHSHVLEGLGIEDLFNLMLGNYEEFERELLVITLRHATYFDADPHWDDSIDTIQLLARRFANLLTTTQGYCDQVPHSISSLFGNPSKQLAEVRGYFRHEHANTLAYRVCTELRRHMQHRGSALHGTSGDDHRSQRPNGGDLNVHTFAPTVNLTRLREDGKVNRSVLEELDADGRRPSPHWRESVDLRPYVREYVAALGRIHLEVREMIAPEMARSDDLIAAAIARFLALPESGGDTLGLAAMELSDQELREAGMPLIAVMTEQTERRKRLERRNHIPTQYHRSVVTNEINPPHEWPKHELK